MERTEGFMDAVQLGLDVRVHMRFVEGIEQGGPPFGALSASFDRQDG